MSTRPSKRVFIRRNKRTGKITGVRTERLRKGGGRRKRRYRSYMNRRTGGFIGLELKFLDCAWNSVAIGVSTDGTGGQLQPSTGCTDCISVPAEGDGQSQRIGRKWTVKSIWVSGVVDSAPLSDNNDAADNAGCFFALVLDKQPNGVTITSSQVYTNPGGSSGKAMLPQPLRNLQFSSRYRVLDTCYVDGFNAYSMQDSLAVATASLNAQNDPMVNLNWQGSIVCEAKDTGADIANATTNAFHVIAFNGGGFTKVFVGKSRMRYMG